MLITYCLSKFDPEYLCHIMEDKVTFFCEKGQNELNLLIPSTCRFHRKEKPSLSLFFLFLLCHLCVPPLLLSETEQKSAEVGEIWNRLVIISIVRGLSQKFAKVNFKPSRPLGWSWPRDAPERLSSQLFLNGSSS